MSIQFRYGQSLIAENLREELAANRLARSIVLLAYVDRTEADKKEGATCPVTPCRYATLTNSSRIGSKFFLAFELGAFAKTAGRTRSRQLSTAISESIPYIGRVLARSTEIVSPTLSLSAYPSIAAELLCEFLARLSKKRQICLFLDNIQELDNWSAQLLSVTVGRAYKRVRYVAGFVTRGTLGTSDIDAFVLRSQDVGYGVGVNRFPAPDDEFIRLYAASFGLEWSHQNCTALATASGGDIYRIRAAVSDARGMKTAFPFALKDLSPPGQLIVGCLAVANCHNFCN